TKFQAFDVAAIFREHVAGKTTHACHRPMAREQRRGATQHCDQHAFGDKLADQPAATRPESLAYSNFFLPISRLCQEQVGDVPTSYQQDQCEERCDLADGRPLLFAAQRRYPRESHYQPNNGRYGTLLPSLTEEFRPLEVEHVQLYLGLFRR